MVADKVPDDLLEIDRQVHGLFVDREMLIAAIFSFLHLPNYEQLHSRRKNHQSNPITEPHQSPARRARTTLRGGRS
jgi:hypothetical protein